MIWQAIHLFGIYFSLIDTIASDHTSVVIFSDDGGISFDVINISTIRLQCSCLGSLGSLPTHQLQFLKYNLNVLGCRILRDKGRAEWYSSPSSTNKMPGSFYCYKPASSSAETITTTTKTKTHKQTKTGVDNFRCHSAAT